MHDPIERFAAFIIQKPLSPYQAEVASAIIHFINHNEVTIITVMMSNESSKNQLRAMIEALLFFTREEDILIRIVPTLGSSLIKRKSHRGHSWIQI